LAIGRTPRAVKSALKINYASTKIINPANEAQYADNAYVLKHVVGIDTSDLFIARTGVHGANDLVWVGQAANYAAKLSSPPDIHAAYITKDVYDAMNAEVKISENR